MFSPATARAMEDGAMIRLLVATALSLTAAAPVAAQVVAPPAATAPASDSRTAQVAALLAAPSIDWAALDRLGIVGIVLSTDAGPITLALDRQAAPATVANFLRYVDQRRLDGTTIYRAMDLGGGRGLIQGGPRNDPKRVLPPVAHEPTSTTGLSHGEGTISLARGAPGTATADFFITLGDMRGLDASATDPGFAAFGRVIGGLDMVRAVLARPRASGGPAGMEGQMLAAPVRIATARRTLPVASATPQRGR